MTETTPLAAVSLPADADQADATCSWYVRGTFGGWAGDGAADLDPRLQRLSGTDFCLRLSAREAPRADGGWLCYEARHWHFHAGPLMRSSGRDDGWAAQINTTDNEAVIYFSGRDPELGPLQLTLCLGMAEAGDAAVAVLQEGTLRQGRGNPSHLGVRRATCRSLGGKHTA